MEKTEGALLSYASHIVYVSPLTLMYQKQFFPNFSEKMECVVLPSAVDYSAGSKSINDSLKIGYFGEYYSYVRNLLPFLNAISSLKMDTIVVGNTNLEVNHALNLKIMPRISFDEVMALEESVDVLVVLANLAGGQIPGKVYYYASTDKIILFILDGSEEEKKVLVDFFGKYNRYVFAENTEEDIKKKLLFIREQYQSGTKVKPIDAFSPKSITSELMK